MIELQIPKSILWNPAFVNIAVLSTGRGQVHTVGDSLGTLVSPLDWKAPVISDIFVQKEMETAD